MRWAGFTLFELLIALLIASVLLTIGIPTLRGIVLDSRRTTDINAFVASVQLARSESAIRGVPVTLCKSEDGQSCGGSGTRFDSGWLVLIDEDDDAPLVSYQPVMRGRIRSNRAAFIFRPNFTHGTNGTVTFCDQRGAPSARAVIISYTGRPRLASSNSRGDQLVCPG